MPIQELARSPPQMDVVGVIIGSSPKPDGRKRAVEDALCSSFDAGHDALMTLYCSRFAEPIELVNSEELMSLWHEDL